jgi:AcrR family transcriptional regulator
MGRKSLADERREEILAAFERCIGRYGIDVPLEQIADEAGVQRSLIRHYLGNRDELVDQVIARIAEAYPRRLAALLAPALAAGTSGVLDFLFADALKDDGIEADWDAVIMAVVNTAQGRYPQAKERVAQIIVAMVEHLAEALAQLFPQATATRRYAVAYSLFCLAQMNDSLLWLGLAPRHTLLARASAACLLDDLGYEAASN